MTIKILAEDTAALPTALMGLAKTHLRVDGSYDDAFIQSCLARAIARFQQVNEVTVNPSSISWLPVADDFYNDGSGDKADIPVRPVSTFSAAIPPDNVSANYVIVLKWDSVYGVPILQLIGPAAANLSVTLTAGYADAAALPPAVLDVVLRHAAHLYENREILLPGREYLAPDLRLDASWWMPRL